MPTPNMQTSEAIHLIQIMAERTGGIKGRNVSRHAKRMYEMFHVWAALCSWPEREVGHSQADTGERRRHMPQLSVYWTGKGRGLRRTC
jgi:hypothetical protein